MTNAAANANDNKTLEPFYLLLFRNNHYSPMGFASLRESATDEHAPLHHCIVGARYGESASRRLQEIGGKVLDTQGQAWCAFVKGATFHEAFVEMAQVARKERSARLGKPPMYRSRSQTEMYQTERQMRYTGIRQPRATSNVEMQQAGRQTLHVVVPKSPALGCMAPKNKRAAVILISCPEACGC